MIDIKTTCDSCSHRHVCKFKGNAERDMKKLKSMNYGKGPNDDYDWDTMSTSRGYNITFTCPNHKPAKEVNFR